MLPEHLSVWTAVQSRVCSAVGGKGQQELDLKGAGTAQTQASPKLMQLPLNMRLTHSTALSFLPFTSTPEILSLLSAACVGGLCCYPSVQWRQC